MLVAVAITGHQMLIWYVVSGPCFMVRVIPFAVSSAFSRKRGARQATVTKNPSPEYYSGHGFPIRMRNG